MIRNLLLIGGDRRALEMEKQLNEDGYIVDTIGLHEGDEATVRPENAQAALFAYPFSVRDGCVPTMTGLTLHPEDMIRKLPVGIPLLAGRGLETEDGCLCRRYEEDCRLEVRNAEISAEAAVWEAMQRTERALMDMTVLVTGYGLFGRALARRLRALGAAVWVAARREEQRLLAAGDGMKPVRMDELRQVLLRMDMIFNTVPALIFGAEELKSLKQDCWMLELASAPYGFARKEADEMDIHYAILPALPAKYAPVSAGMALKNAAVQLLLEVEG